MVGQSGSQSPRINVGSTPTLCTKTCHMSLNCGVFSFFCQCVAHRVQSSLTAEPKLRKQIAHWGYNWRRSEHPVPQTVIECYMTVDRGQQVALTFIGGDSC